MKLSYYIISTLPALQFNETPKISYAEFLQTAARLLGEGDYATLEKARLANLTAAAGGNPALTRYQLWESDLRNRLSTLRDAARQGADQRLDRAAEPTLDNIRVSRAVAEAADPWQGEIIQNRARWEFLSSLETGHQFDIDYLIIYALKLQILERIAAMSPTAGDEAFQDLEEDLHRELLEKMVEAEGGIKMPREL